MRFAADPSDLETVMDPDRPASTFEDEKDPPYGRSAAVFLTIYLGTVVGFGALMPQLLHVAAG